MFRRLFRLPATRQSLERDVDEEIRYHIDRRVDDLVRQGRTLDAARDTAEREYGDRAASRAELVRVDRRRFERTRRRGWWEAVRQDVRFAVRTLRARPGFTLAVALTFGLGLGANAAMFEVVDRLLLRPPAFLRDPSTVHRVYVRYRFQREEIVDRSLEYTRYLDFQRWTTRFSQSAAFAFRELALGDGADAQEMPVAAVSASFFRFYDARPTLGRFFTAREDTVPAGAPVAVLGHAFWRTRYGGRADVLGKTLRVGTVLCTIVGVAPDGFVGMTDERPPAVFIPITTFAGSIQSPETSRGYYTSYSWGWLQMLVRRKPGVTADAATADLTSAYERSWAAQRAQEPGLAPTAIARPTALAGPVSLERGPQASASARVATWLGGVAIAVLLVACANVANLLLARALARRREISMRLALGAGRRRVLGMLLSESLLLALLGGVVGVLAAQFGGAVLRALFLPAGTAGGALGDPRTLLVVAATAVLAGLTTGLMPALGARRNDLTTTLRAGDRGGTATRSRARTVLLVFQGALSVTLLVGAGLFVRSFHNVQSLRLGFDADPVLYVAPNLRGATLSKEERTALGARLLEAARTMPGVEAAALGASVPLSDTWGQSFTVPGVDSVSRFGRFTVQASTGDYFRTMGTRLLRGRPITDDDRADTPPVAVVSEGMASTLWPGRDAIGQCIKIRDGAKDPPCTTVVGIVENIKQTGLGDDQRQQYYLARPQARNGQRPLVFVRMRDGDARHHAESLRRRLQALMPGAGYVTVTPMRDVVDPRMQSWRLGATLFAAFGALALLVAAVGLYAVIAYDVARQTRDIGVRLALGARAGAVLRLVLGAGLRLAASGLAIGGVIALVGARRMAPLLFGESPNDPLVYGAVGAVLLAVAVVACAIPAARAARVDPSVTLRAE
ncbi:permease (plasmid) [Gemmatirosa kalamazoonensis]|uniref:Permease n=1 Tax=Gemmatirosa kalamazoonensis TaxID=861299 RepID=W0RRK4_9BACT|nr:ADOP family duplicated permease [Gemmatirosa kalamazoonensis]AHG93097.1 permease [Gemmatirosa kalamazoonensis]